VAIVAGVIVSRAAWKRHAAALAVFAVGVFCITLARYFYYGDLLPNTFSAKVTSLKGVVASVGDFALGSITHIPALFAGPLAILVLVYGLFCLWKRKPEVLPYALGILAAGYGICIYGRDDWTQTPRLFAPYVPVAAIVLWLGVVEVWRRLAEPWLAVSCAALTAMMIMFAGVIEAYAYLRPQARAAKAVLMGEALVEPAVWTGDNVPDDAVIAGKIIGSLAYYSKKNVFDWKYGLTNREVARSIQKNMRHVSHLNDPMLRDEWINASPGYLTWEFPCDDDGGTGAVWSSVTVHGMTYRPIKVFPLEPTTVWVLFEKEGE
jgi:hypothetical protein